jgi:hypothetical protein
MSSQTARLDRDPGRVLARDGRVNSPMRVDVGAQTHDGGQPQRGPGLAP